MTLPVSAARAHLAALHDELRSWRKVQELHYPTIPAGTLCSVAKGDPIPRKHRAALLGQGRRDVLPGEKRVKRKIAKMAKETREAVLR
jgi:hypothetical protein